MRYSERFELSVPDPQEVPEVESWQERVTGDEIDEVTLGQYGYGPDAQEDRLALLRYQRKGEDVGGLKTYEEAKTAIDILPASRHFDGACGNGKFTKELSDQQAQRAREWGRIVSGSVVGGDLMPKMYKDTYEEVKGRHPKLRFVRADMTKLEGDDFKDGTFDSVSILNGLNHISKPYAALEELRRVLRPGGHLIIMTRGACHYAEPWDWATQAALRAGFEPPKNFYSSITPEEIHAARERLGFLLPKLFSVPGTTPYDNYNVSFLDVPREGVGDLLKVVWTILRAIKPPSELSGSEELEQKKTALTAEIMQLKQELIARTQDGGTVTVRIEDMLSVWQKPSDSYP